MGLAIVNTTTGLVRTIIRDDYPPSWTCPAGYRLVPERDLPAGWQREPDPEPEPVTAQIGSVTVQTTPDRLTLPARVVLESADLEVTDPDSGVILHDEQGRGWLLVPVAGQAALVQVSASPEISKEQRKAAIAAHRAAASVAKAKADVERLKDKTKLTVAQRISRIEDVLGI